MLEKSSRGANFARLPSSLTLFIQFGDNHPGLFAPGSLSTVGFLERHQKMVKKARISGITDKSLAFFGLLDLSKGAFPLFSYDLPKNLRLRDPLQPLPF